jgi:hypothetical protein
VFTDRDSQPRLRMLQARLPSWRAAQPLYGLGPVIAAAGFGWLAVHGLRAADDRWARAPGCRPALRRLAVWLGWLTLVADLLFLAGYMRCKDIPPFVFYLLLRVVGLVIA